MTRKPMSEEQKEKIRQALKGKKKSDEARLNMSKAHKTRPPVSEETRRKMSEARKGKKRKPLTEEQKQKIREATKAAMQRPDVRARYEASREEAAKKMVQTKIERYGSATYFGTDESNARHQEYLQKSYETMKKNSTFRSSKLEHHLFDMLKAKFPDAEHFYRSDEYPWVCDFYVKSRKLYIEFNGSWHHGGMAFDENNDVCLDLINYWQKCMLDNDAKEPSWQYECAITTFTKTDVKKRNHAKNNNLNWLEFFSEKEFLEWLETV